MWPVISKEPESAAGTGRWHGKTAVRARNDKAIADVGCLNPMNGPLDSVKAIETNIVVTKGRRKNLPSQCKGKSRQCERA